MDALGPAELADVNLTYETEAGSMLSEYAVSQYNYGTSGVSLLARTHMLASLDIISLTQTSNYMIIHKFVLGVVQN